MSEEKEVAVHVVKIALCELCLQGEGEECHTPGCALWMKNSPGVPISEELYEIQDMDGKSLDWRDKELMDDKCK